MNFLRSAYRAAEPNASSVSLRKMHRPASLRTRPSERVSTCWIQSAIHARNALGENKDRSNLSVGKYGSYRITHRQIAADCSNKSYFPIDQVFGW